MNPHDVISFTIFLVLPLFVVFTRTLASRRLPRAGVPPFLFPPGEKPSDILLRELANDLAIMGMTLGFASYALAAPAQKQLNAAFLLLPFFPFAVMSVMPIVESPRIRLGFGLIAYLIGVATIFNVFR
jgi:hypothetical protein